MGGGFGTPPDDVLRALAERDLVFELMAHPDLLESSAAALADWGELTVVVEHAGWPRDDSPEEFALWKRGISALAALGDNVHCKLSGLAMPLHSMEASALAPWIEHCLASFGVDRCMFASNFPVEKTAVSYTVLWNAFKKLASSLSKDEVDALFRGTAAKVYRIEQGGLE